MGTPHPNGIPLSERQRAYGDMIWFSVILFFFPALIFVLPHLHIVGFFSQASASPFCFFFLNYLLSAKDCSLTLKCPSPALLPPPSPPAFFFHPLFLIACAREQRKEKERIPSFCEIQEREIGRQAKLSAWQSETESISGTHCTP